MTRRRATSLVELLLAMSAFSLILTMSATLIHRVLHVQTRSRAINDGERSALRLSEQFRRDIHAAATAESDGSNLGAGVVLRLQLPSNETIEYRHADGVVLRVLLEGNAPKAREQFNFPANIQLSVRAEPRGLLTLSLAPPAGAADAIDSRSQVPAVPPLSLQATAKLNRPSAPAASPQEAAP